MRTTANRFFGVLALALSGCGGGGGSGAPAATVAAIRSFTASSSAVERKQQVVLTPEFEGGTGVVTPTVGSVASGTPVQVDPAGDTLYRLTVTGQDGSVVTSAILVLEFDHVVTSTLDDGPGTLREAMLDARSAGGGRVGVLATPIVLDAPLPTVDGDLSISGVSGAEVIDGAGAHRIFFMTAPGDLALADLTLRGGRAEGGAGGGTSSGGGGGGAAGMGAALFVEGGDAVLTRVRFEGNVVVGGRGGGEGGSPGGGGGGGIGGPGAPAGINGGTGGSGGPLGGAGGLAHVDGGPGAGGGGAGYVTTQRAGAGGFGGGGGGGGYATPGGAGGYGGGGGAARTTAAAGGFAGGAGGSAGESARGGGGGGAGLGGAVFVRAGTLRLIDVAFVDNVATGGAGGEAPVAPGQDGLGKGGAVFVHADGFAFGHGVTFAGNAASDALGIAGDDNDVFGLLDLD